MAAIAGVTSTQDMDERWGRGGTQLPRHPPPLGFPEPSNHCEADESGFPRVTWDAKLHTAPRLA